MQDRLQNLKNQALAQILSATSKEELDNIRFHYLGKKGELNEISKLFPTLSSEDKAELGKLLNETKHTIEDAILNSHFSSSREKSLDFDSTLPGIRPSLGHLHPVTRAISEIESIFESIGFIRVRYPEVDWDYYAFESLNMSKGHPARDEWETFFVTSPTHSKLGRIVLTPHTSNGQVREMERLGHPPIRMINIAKCYRRQADVSHTPMFHQFEGLVIDKDIKITHLKGTIDYFVTQFFGPNRKSRLRPYHFQFTEPSFEVDVTCNICEGKGVLSNGDKCRLCKSGWLELGGAGMVHPYVLKSGNIDPNIYTGFAFGWGVERTYMMKSGLKIDDLRIFYENDIRFLNQF